MSERYTRVFSLPDNLYLDGAPMLIAAGALLKDNDENGKVLAQLKLQNLAEARLIACKVAIQAFDIAGTQVQGIESYSYLDISISRGENFGAKVPIALPDSTTRKMTVSIIQTVFDNGDVWQDSTGVWTPLAPHKLIADDDIRQQYSIEVGRKCEYVPLKIGDLFLCTCGEINLSEYTVCSGCRRETARLLSAFNTAELTRKRALRLRQEREREEKRRIAREREEEERRIAREREEEEWRIAREREEERKHIAEIARKKKRRVVLVAVAIVIVGVIVAKVILPANQYRRAEELLSMGKREEAMEAFAKLGEYKDAKERIIALWNGESISAGFNHIVGLKGDGTVMAVGNNEDGQCDVGGWRDIVSVSAGDFYTVGLKSDGTVVAAGDNQFGQCDVGGWRDIVSVSAGFNHIVGLKNDGTVVATGNNKDGQCDVGEWRDIVSVSAGVYYTVGLKSDGTVVAAGVKVDGWTGIVVPKGKK